MLCCTRVRLVDFFCYVACGVIIFSMTSGLLTFNDLVYKMWKHCLVGGSTNFACWLLTGKCCDHSVNVCWDVLVHVCSKALQPISCLSTLSTGTTHKKGLCQGLFQKLRKKLYTCCCCHIYGLKSRLFTIDVVTCDLLLGSDSVRQ